MQTNLIPVLDDFYLNNLYWIIALVVLAGVGLYFLFDYFHQKRKAAAKKPLPNKGLYLASLGGEENILSHELVGSRIILHLKDYSKVNKSQLEQAGVTGFIEKSDKLTLVVKDDSERVYKAIFGEA
jgi:phosphotransferase system IIB component